MPGKEEFHETVRYFRHELGATGVTVKLGERADAAGLAAAGFDKVVLATGVSPRPLDIPGSDHPSVVGYADVLSRAKPVGDRVAIIGAGGIGFDVAEFLSHGADATAYAASAADADWPSVDGFLGEWDIDPTNEAEGGIEPAGEPAAERAGRTITLLQRKKGKHGAGLGKTTGWIHRANLRKRGVSMLGGVRYERVDDDGLHVVKGGEALVLAVDTVVVCAGQLSETGLEAPLADAGVPTYKIGGAYLAAELDAKSAIDQACRLAAQIEDAEPSKVGEYAAPLGHAAWLYNMVKGARAAA